MADVQTVKYFNHVGMKMTSGVRVSNGVELAHSATIGMRSAISLRLGHGRTYSFVATGQRSPHERPCVRPRSAADYSSAALLTSHSHQQGKSRAGMSAASGLVRSNSFRMAEVVGVASGVELAHSAIIGMRLALPLHTLQPYALICRYMAPPTP